jgi:predicted outer membrane repeat protein
MTRSARRALSALTALVMTGTLFVGAPSPTYANGSSVTYYVAQTGDPDGNGSSCTDPDFVGGDEGPIALAVDLATDGDTIYICAGTYAIENTIDLVNELLTLQGAGAGVTILDGGSDTLILDCTTATVSGLTFLDGRAASGEGGGGPDDGGAISCTTVTVTNSTFMNNNGGDGGAISGTTVTVTNSTFIGNDANSFVGGAIAADGTATVTNSTFIGNEALIGGAIAAFGTTVRVTNSTFVGNSAAFGGAIATFTGIIAQSRFRRNTAREIGGAVIFYDPNSDDLRKLRGNTFRLNAAPLGGAILLNACGTTVSRKKALRIERANLFLRNSATDQQRTKNIDRWSCSGA